MVFGIGFSLDRGVRANKKGMPDNFFLAHLAAFSQYTIESTSPGKQGPMRTISSLGHYAILRHGARATTLYSLLYDTALSDTCR